jgi:hypothetical protein
MLFIGANTKVAKEKNKIEQTQCSPNRSIQNAKMKNEKKKEPQKKPYLLLKMKN